MVEFKPSPVYDRIVVGDDGTIIGRRGKPLKLMIDPNGYERVSIYMGFWNDKHHWKRVGAHRLVCETFHGLKPDWADLVAHSNGNPADNRADNLRWATFEQNEADKRKHGRDNAGERHHMVKLTEPQVLEIRCRRAAGERGTALAREFGVTASAICAIHKRQSWGHLS
jgi:hypothetical protein